jgi:hypothetical protein
MTFLFWGMAALVITGIFLVYAVDLTIEAEGIKKTEQTHLEQVKKISSEKPLLLSQYSKTMSKLKIDLKRDRDNRPDKALEQLDLLRDIIEMEYANKKISVDVYNKFSKVFGFILDLMTDSYEHWRLIKDANGDYKDKLNQALKHAQEKIQAKDGVEKSIQSTHEEKYKTLFATYIHLLFSPLDKSALDCDIYKKL